MTLNALMCAITLCGLLSAAALAADAPSRFQLPGTAGALPDPLASLPPALLRPQQADPATANLVWRAVVERYPEIVEGPARGGAFIVAIALRPDGSVVRSGMREVERGSPSFITAQQEMREMLPTDARSVPGMAFSIQPRGTVVLGDRALKGDVILNSTMVASNWDETRDSGIVRREILQTRAELFLPMSGDRINRLTVTLTDDGHIAQEKVEAQAIDRQGNMTRIGNGCGFPIFPASLAAGDADKVKGAFAGLGLGPDQIGLVGMLGLDLPSASAPRPAPPAPVIGADGIARGPQPVFEGRVLQVCYAWPRRPGEPIGGTALAWDSIPQNEPSKMLQLTRKIEQNFPYGSPSDGNWMLLTHDGDVLRTGHVELGKDEQLTRVYMERMFPGIKIGGNMGMGQGVNSKSPGEGPQGMVKVTAYFLTPDSPLPPAEGARPAAR